jgi:hypothetical protein
MERQKEDTLSGTHNELDAERQTPEMIPLIPLQSVLPGTCLCGGPLNADGDFVVCENCGRPYCPDCGGPVVHGGGCQSCAVCGYGFCA